MKISKLVLEGDAPGIWRFMRKHLPPSMKADSWEGYGKHYYVSSGNTRVAQIDNMMFPSIIKFFARCTDIVEVMHPAYLSDIQDVARKYEAETGGRVWIRYWDECK
jgi:hypothetical protein